MSLKVKPLDHLESREKEKKSVCVDIIMKLVCFLSNALGLWPFDQEKMEFQLFSKKSLSSILKLTVLTVPVLVVPITIYYTGWLEKEFETTVNEDDYIGIERSFVEALLFAIEFFVNFLIYILPFAFAAVTVKPKKRCKDIMKAPHNRDIEYYNTSGIIFPIIGFGLFTVGKLLKTVDILWEKWQMEGFSQMYIPIYIQVCLYFFANIHLHFFLASYENFFYDTVCDYGALAQRFLELRMDSRTLLKRGGDIASMMENLQEAFGFFLLVSDTTNYDDQL